MLESSSPYSKGFSSNLVVNILEHLLEVQFD